MSGSYLRDVSGVTGSSEDLLDNSVLDFVFLKEALVPVCRLRRTERIRFISIQLSERNLTIVKC